MKEIDWSLALICGLPSVAYFVWAYLDLVSLTRWSGKIKRGIRVWEEPIPDLTYNFLRSLREDIKDGTSFIRVGQEGAVVFAFPRRFATSIPYVGYVDFTKDVPKIQYRSTLPPLLSLIPFIISLVLLPFVAVVLIANHLVLRRAILSFIDKQMQCAPVHG
jgi:hypothetical protein